MQRLLNLIGGEWKAPMANTWFARENPSTGELHAEVPDSDLLEIVQAVQAGHHAFQAWQKDEDDKRLRLLNAIATKLEEQREELARVQAVDTGILLGRARELVSRASQLFRARAAALAAHAQCETSADAPATAETARVRFGLLPVGLVGILTPWSDALWMMASRTSAALAAGNAVILKPSELAPLTADRFAHLVLEALLETGLPAGVFNLVQGRGVQAGMALAKHPGVATLSFTGRTENGKKVLEASAEFLKKTHLALGARNPVLVFADTNLEELMPLLKRIALGNHAPACLRGSRFFVQESVYKRFLELFGAALANTTVGDPLDERTELGPMISAAEKARFLAATAQAEREKGKDLLASTSPSENPMTNVTDNGEGKLSTRPAPLSGGNFVRPTVSYDLTLCSTLQQDEVVGPFISVSSFKYLHEAVKHANNSPLGQAAYVFQADGAKALRVASQLAAGRVFVNQEPCDLEAFTYGGVKHSGLGREGGDELTRFFSRETLMAF